jgi:hypothetical protein
MRLQKEKNGKGRAWKKKAGGEGTYKITLYRANLYKPAPWVSPLPGSAKPSHFFYSSSGPPEEKLTQYFTNINAF